MNCNLNLFFSWLEQNSHLRIKDLQTPEKSRYAVFKLSELNKSGLKVGLGGIIKSQIQNS